MLLSHSRPFLLVAALMLATLPASADVAVRVEGVEGALADNVRALLSVQRYATTKDLDAETLDRLVGRAEREVRTALKPFGHYEPEVTTETRAVKAGWEVVLRIKPGPVVKLVESRVEVAGPGKDEPFFRNVLSASPLTAGKTLSHADYESVKGELLRQAAAHGYLDAQLSSSQLLVDVAAHEARAILVLETGERYRFGATRITQDVVKPALVERFLRWRKGDWFDSVALLRTQFALDDSEYFGLVEVLPGDRDREARTVPVQIKADAGDRYRWTIGAGYATDTRFRGTLGFRNRRVNDSGHRLDARVQYSEVEQTATLTYTIPWDDPALEKLSFRLEAENTTNGDLETSGVTLRSGLTQVRGNWQRVLFVEASSTTSDTGTVAVLGEPSQTRSSDRLLVPGISYAKLPPTITGVAEVGRGLFAELLGSTAALGSNSNFLRLRVQDERRIPLARTWTLLLRGQLGLSAISEFEELPPDYRFFAGGDRSVRGYGLDELSPVNSEGERIGGRHLVVGSVEIEHDLPYKLAVAVFFDAGNAVNRLGDPLEYSAGVGIRFKLPFVSVGLDVAQSLSESGRNPRLHLNVTPVF
ncbi:MAG: BamA/TamA family outer membrane protein [Gammaproteobacteria bacterium]|nr:BamA/TamA family outer membrane protein [Gammaproteobacteria bacterium]